MKIPSRASRDNLFSMPSGDLVGVEDLADLIDPGVSDEDRDERAWEGDRARVTDRKLNVLYRRLVDSQGEDARTFRTAMSVVLRRALDRDPAKSTLAKKEDAE